jgi:NTP pyrophosphatase (non-canonical NTP hydrolase)
MRLDEYQQEALKTAHFSPTSMPRAAYHSLGLAGEAGEVANKVKKIYRDDQGQLTPARVAAIKKEMGGALWYMATLANDLGFKLSEVAEANIAELRSRQQRGTIHGDGDNR